MRPPIIVVLTLAASLLCACDRGDKTPPPAPPPPPAAAVAAPPPPIPAPAPAPPLAPDGQPVFPTSGTPYAQARAALIAQGMTPYVFAAAAPGHPECARKQKQCVFVWTDKTGLASYLIVLVDPAFSAVEVVGFSTQDEARSLNLAPLNLPPPSADDLAPAVNPYARDAGRESWTTQRLPSIAGPYKVAREKLVAAGFAPVPGKAGACKPPKPPPTPPAGPPGAIPAPPAVPAAPTLCRPPGSPPEIHGCAVAGVSACQAVWARDNQTLVVNTLGDPAPGDIDNLYWATPAEAADFRAGRR